MLHARTHAPTHTHTAHHTHTHTHTHTVSHTHTHTCTRWATADSVVCDFAAGTGPAALAGLFLNQFKVVINDRDTTIMEYTRARIRAYLSALQLAPHWERYAIPGVNPFADTPWNGACPYIPLLVAIGAPKKTGTLYPGDNDLFSGMAMTQIAEQNDCKVDEDGGTLSVIDDFAKGDQLPLFGVYSTSFRHPTPSDKGIMLVELKQPVLKRATQKSTPLYLKPSLTCPFKYVNKTQPGGVPNCRVVENSGDWFWPNKVCLEITTPIEADSDHPVLLLCSYEGLTKPCAATRSSDTLARPRKRRRGGKKLEDGPPDGLEDEDDGVYPQLTDNEEYSGRSDAEEDAEYDEDDNAEGDAAEDAAEPDAAVERAERLANRQLKKR